jgi:AcrR family transcriptional regulator
VPPASRARRKPKADPRAALLEAGTRLFAARGFDDVSIEEIAVEAGISKGLVYYYFVSKRGLYVEIVRLAFDELAVYTKPDPRLPPRERTEAVITALIRWARSYGESVRLLFAQTYGTDPDIKEILRKARDGQVDLIVSAVYDAGVESALAPIAPEPLLRHAVRGWAAFVEAVLSEWLEHSDLTETEVRDLILHAAGGLLAAARATAADHTDTGSVPEDAGD